MSNGSTDKGHLALEVDTAGEDRLAPREETGILLEVRPGMGAFRENTSTLAEVRVERTGSRVTCVCVSEFGRTESPLPAAVALHGPVFDDPVAVALHGQVFDAAAAVVFSTVPVEVLLVLESVE